MWEKKKRRRRRRGGGGGGGRGGREGRELKEKAVERVSTPLSRGHAGATGVSQLKEKNKETFILCLL